MMYSWAATWTGDCNQQAFLEFNENNNSCFTSPWTANKNRDKLWCTCNRPGREVGHLLLYGIADITSQASREGGAGCGRADLINIRDTIREGHQQVTGLKIYALLSTGKNASEYVPEAALVPSLLWYNDNCAASQQEKLDGVAVNNEDFPREGTETEKIAFLDSLSNVARNAGAELQTHFSLSWNWFASEPRNVEFNGTTKNVVQHMIDMFDSTDMQTAFITGEEMVARMQKDLNKDLNETTATDANDVTAWSYAQIQGKKMFTTLYLNKIEIKEMGDCSTTFFPDPECTNWTKNYQTEEKMWEEVGPQMFSFLV